MATIKQYRAFKANLLGYTEVEFTEFRNQILPLRKKRTWSEEECNYAQTLIDAGAGRALQQLCGQKHPAVTSILGSEEIAAERMPKNELEGHIRAVVKGRSPEWIAKYVAYLNSESSPEEFDDSQPKPTGTLSTTKDHFAEMYRNGGEGFRRVVNEQLVIAAGSDEGPE